MGQNQMLITFALIFIFSFALVTFGVQFGNLNDANVNIGDDPSLSDYSTESVTRSEAYRVEINGTLKSLQETEITENSETGAIVKDKENSNSQAMLSMLSLVQNKIFGGSTASKVIFTTVTSLVLFIFGLYVVKTLRGGNPD